MQTETLLDRAHADMEAAPDDDTARLRFYEHLAASELFMMLASDLEAGSDTVTPDLFQHDGAQYVLVFDREDRLSTFAGEATSYVALSGRAIVEMLAGQGIGLGVNLEVAPSSILLPDGAITWLHDTLGHVPDTVEERISELLAPTGLPEQLIEALDTRLATAMGLAQAAYLAAVAFDNGTRGHLLAFVGSIPEAESALTQVASEALTFSGLEAGTMDIGFFDANAPIVESLQRVGLRFDLPQLQQTVTQDRPAPGMDPANPPKLK